jgi:hypothetical protein
MLIKVRTAKPLGDYRLMVEFSDDTVGERDFSSGAQRGTNMMKLLNS